MSSALVAVVGKWEIALVAVQVLFVLAVIAGAIIVVVKLRNRTDRSRTGKKERSTTWIDF